MYTCDKVFKKHCIIFLAVSVFVAIFGIVYEWFGHGILSMSMILAFLYPFLLGFIPTLGLSFSEMMATIPYEKGIRFGCNLFYSGIATLTVGSIAMGVVEIYGTTNRFMIVYTVAGIVMLFVGMCAAGIAFVKKAKENEDTDADEDGEEGIPFES